MIVKQRYAGWIGVLVENSVYNSSSTFELSDMGLEQLVEYKATVKELNVLRTNLRARMGTSAAVAEIENLLEKKYAKKINEIEGYDKLSDQAKELFVSTHNRHNHSKLDIKKVKEHRTHLEVIHQCGWMKYYPDGTVG